MTSILRRLWHDDRGFILSTELIFLATITVIGVLVGLVIWRDGIVQELGDAGAAIGQFNQSYSIDVQSNSTCGVVVKADSVIITRDAVGHIRVDEPTGANDVVNHKAIAGLKGGTPRLRLGQTLHASLS